MNLSGRSIIGSRTGVGAGEEFRASNPRTGAPLAPGFVSATAEEVELAARLAHEAFVTYSRASGRDKGALLRKIAANIESGADEVVARAEEETALPRARLQGELGRTCGQLRLFAEVVEEGSWVMARIDHAQPDRKPAPKPDIRSMLRPLGPVVVFGASNFPLAFSVAGGDTASALAAGNPVIVKAHPAHPSTSELVARAMRDAVQQCGLPEGVFSLLFDAGVDVGLALVKHPLVKAGGFTGSLKAGRALMDVAAARPQPIPFFAEMSSTNPVFILPGALRERAGSIAAGLHASFTLGAGQFCTKPGMVFLPEGSEGENLLSDLQRSVGESARFHLLTQGIQAGYDAGVAARKAKAGVTTVAEEVSPRTGTAFSVSAVVFATDVECLEKNPDLAEELFGPSTLLIRHRRREQLLRAARNLGGHLTATIHGTEEDLQEYGELVAILEGKAGRLIFNGFPTGVEVTHAMVHGGPYPATSDGRSTSVGSMAIFRFARPVCFQGFPDAALPEELKEGNPLGIWRLVDGEMKKS